MRYALDLMNYAYSSCITFYFAGLAGINFPICRINYRSNSTVIYMVHGYELVHVLNASETDIYSSVINLLMPSDAYRRQ